MTSLPKQLEEVLRREGVREFRLIKHTMRAELIDKNERLLISDPRRSLLYLTETSYVEKLERIIRAVGPLVELFDIEADCDFNGEYKFAGRTIGFPAHDKNNCRKCEALAAFEKAIKLEES